MSRDTRIVTMLGAVVSIRMANALREAGYAIEEFKQVGEKLNRIGIEIHALDEYSSNPAAEIKHEQSWQSLNRGKLSKKERRK